MSSSGDLAADRRFDLAMQLRGRGDVAAAADVMSQAIALAPRWAAGRFALAETLAMAGETTASLAAFKAYLELVPSDSMGAAARIHLLAGGDVPTFSESYVRRLFDQYAPRFDRALTERLAYAVPELLRAMIDRTLPARRFARAIDLGCGTGLVGAALRERVDWLTGVDLSPGMIAEAERKGAYQRLTVGDIVTTLAGERDLDLALAGDVLCYVRDLAPVFAAVDRALRPGGAFAFSVERGDGAAVTLGPGHRFQHGAALIHQLAGAGGFSIAAEQTARLRQDGGKEVIGLLFILSKIDQK